METGDNAMSREQRLERAQLRVLFNAPFFAAGVARLPVAWDEGVPTAITDGKDIRWNPGWFDQLKDEEVVTVYCEAVSHCMLGHLWRQPVGADMDNWGRACDAAARCMMDAFGKIQTNQGLANPFPLPEKVVREFNHAAYDEMAEEKIYRILQAQPKQPGGGNGPGAGQGGGGGGQPPPSGGKGKKPPKSPSGANGGQPPQTQRQPFSEFAPQGRTDPAQQKQENNWQNVLIQSDHAAKSRGAVPLGIDRMIGELLTPQVPWQEILRNLLRELANDDWNFMKPDLMMSDSTGFIMPSLESERMGSVCFAIDTSGSIDHELLTEFKGEMQACLDDMKPSSVLEICCDSAIHRIKEYRRGGQVDDKAPGGGGTAFEPVFEHLKDQPQLPKCVVYLTDLDGSFPKEEPPYPVIWIAYGTDKKAPFGDTVHVK
jgi:predicted metal-dependent peptidase